MRYLGVWGLQLPPSKMCVEFDLLIRNFLPHYLLFALIDAPVTPFENKSRYCRIVCRALILDERTPVFESIVLFSLSNEEKKSSCSDFASFDVRLTKSMISFSLCKMWTGGLIQTRCYNASDFRRDSYADAGAVVYVIRF